MTSLMLGNRFLHLRAARYEADNLNFVVRLSRAALAKKLFDRLSADLVLIRPEMQAQVLCPLCVRPFERAALGLKTDHGLTLEHIIPGAVGGRWVTVTCRRCNNNHGSALDAHFVRMTRSRDWLDGDGSTLKGSVRIDDAVVPMKISWGAGARPNVIRVLGGKAEMLRRFREQIEWMCEGSQVHLNFSLDYIEVNARRALVRMGYLSLFDRFGYSYALSEAATWVRKLIGGSDDDQLWRLLPQLGEVEQGGRAEQVTIVPVGDERATVAYLVVMRIDARQTRHHAVLLPAPNVPEESAMTVLSDVGSQLHEKRHSIRIVDQS